MKDLLKIVGGKQKHNVDIITVTFNNVPFLRKWVHSVLNWTTEPHRVILVNNGGPLDLVDNTIGKVTYLPQEKNLGWMGGVNAGIRWCLANSTAPYILMMNDDTQVLDNDYGWLTKMVAAFDLDPQLGAVGPTSNKVMGSQNTDCSVIAPYHEVTFLSGMALLVRRDVIEEIGLLDESLPGGDDLDYSIRIRKAGYKLAVCRRTFLLHHYGATGKRVHGADWDSQRHTEAINTALIKKHGFKTWFHCVNGNFSDSGKHQAHPGVVEAEEKAVLDEIQEELEKGVVLDLGCGGKKIHPKAVGVDFRPNGDLGCGVNELHPSIADVEAEVTDLKPFADHSADALVAKHIFEHILDIPKALKEWKRVLKPGGKLVVVCPDYRYCSAIACDPSHVHAFTPDAVRSWFEALGWEVSTSEHLDRTFVFMTVARKQAVQRCSCHPEKVTVGCAP